MIDTKQVSSRTVWEWLYHDKDFQEILKKVPDEFSDWIKKEREDLKKKYMDILWKALDGYAHALDLKTRKDRAIYIQNHHKEYSHIVFAMLDGKQYAKQIWKMFYPEFRVPTCLEKVKE